MSFKPLYFLLLATSLLPAFGCRELSRDKRSLAGAACDVAALDRSGVSGRVVFIHQGRGLLVTLDLSGLSPGLHGVSINEYGACGDQGNDAGARLNPTRGEYGNPDGRVGDLGDVLADGDGHAYRSFEDDALALDGKVSVVGLTLLVHARPDGVETAAADDSGSRLACGVIYRTQP